MSKNKVTDLQTIRRDRQITEAYEAAMQAIQDLRSALISTREMYLYQQACTDQLEDR